MRRVALRAERLGTGSGHVYTLDYQGIDRAGDSASCLTTVVVPHDRGSQRQADGPSVCVYAESAANNFGPIEVLDFSR
jgi:hypothetical protein